MFALWNNGIVTRLAGSEKITKVRKSRGQTFLRIS